MKKTLYRAAAATVLGLSLTTGMAAAQSGTIRDTGADSSNHISSHVRNTQRVRNNNNLRLHNSNWQSAESGDASSSKNTHGGSATTGSVRNDNSLSASVTVRNTAQPISMNAGGAGNGSASISDTGYNSDNTVRSSVVNTSTVENNNNICITNDNEQEAESGDASVSKNTNGGSATSGSATNTNSSSFTLSVSN